MTFAWAALETELNAPPRFHVAAPDGRRDWGEEERCKQFVTLMHRIGPKCMVHHVKNEGRYNHALAKRIWVVPGVFDYRIDGERPLSAVVEFKGYDRRGRAGKLSQAQVDWGNSMLDRGWLVGCFFDPVEAVEWLRRNGFQIAQVRA